MIDPQALLARAARRQLSAVQLHPSRWALLREQPGCGVEVLATAETPTRLSLDLVLFDVSMREAGNALLAAMDGQTGGS